MSTWKYLDNQFAVSTENSFRKMLILSTDHAAKLLARAAEPGIGPLHTRYAPIHAAYAAAYTAWTATSGTQEGATAAMQAQIDLLSSTKARQWDVKTQAVFDLNTAEYKAIWPNGRGPLQSGSLDLRIAAIAALHTRMGPYAAALGAPLVTEVTAFHAVVLALRETQQGIDGGTDADSTALEAARVAAAEMLYGNLGVLMDLFRAGPEAVADFYDLPLIRTTGGGGEPVPVPPGP